MVPIPASFPVHRQIPLQLQVKKLDCNHHPLTNLRVQKRSHR
eukprot:SAG31_NODE_2899_length_4933_cov_2.793795_1_plen_41_part_10